MPSPKATASGDDKRFWDIIAFACHFDPTDPDLEVQWYDNLVAALATLPPDDIVRFDWWFDEKIDALYTRLHWGAAHLINGGASDDGFYYWRCWLVGMGKQIYEAALQNPDSLANVITPHTEYEAEIYACPRAAWTEILHFNDEEFDRKLKQLGKRKNVKLTGREWDFDNINQMRRRFPKLWQLCQ